MGFPLLGIFLIEFKIPTLVYDEILIFIFQNILNDFFTKILYKSVNCKFFPKCYTSPFAA